MPTLGGQFDASQFDPQMGPPPAMEPGWYNVMITASEIKQASSGQGNAYVEFTMKVLDGPNAGRLIFDRLNLWNSNPVAVEIAQKALSGICHGTGVMVVSETEALHAKPFMVRLKIEEQEGYDPSNKVVAYDKPGSHAGPSGGGSATAPGTPAAPAAPAAPPAPSAPEAPAAAPEAPAAPAAPPAPLPTPEQVTTEAPAAPAAAPMAEGEAPAPAAPQPEGTVAKPSWLS